MIQFILPEPVIPSNATDPSRRPDPQGAKLDALAAAQGVALEQARRYGDVEGGFFAAAERTEDAPESFENEALLGLRFKIALPFWNKNEGAIQEAQAKQTRVLRSREKRLQLAAARLDSVDS